MALVHQLPISDSAALTQRGPRERGLVLASMVAAAGQAKRDRSAGNHSRGIMACGRSAS